MRVTDKMMTENAITYMDDNKYRLHVLQERVASGKQFLRASDNPVGATAALSLRSSLETTRAYIDANSVTENWMGATDASMLKLADVTRNAIKLSMEGISTTQGPTERQALAAELNMSIEQAIVLGNTSHQGSYIFSGFKTTTISFTRVDANNDGQAESVTYNGDTGLILRNISPGQTVTQNITGDTVFSPLFDAMIRARDALQAGDMTALQTALRDLQNGLTNATEATTTNGARQRQVRQISERLETTSTDLKSLLSQKEDVNMAEAISYLRNQETVYQAVLEVGQRTISSLNLFQVLG